MKPILILLHAVGFVGLCTQRPEGSKSIGFKFYRVYGGLGLNLLGSKSTGFMVGRGFNLLGW